MVLFLALWSSPVPGERTPAAVCEEGGGEARRRSPGAACGVSTATVPPVSPVPVPVMVWQAWTA